VCQGDMTIAELGDTSFAKAMATATPGRWVEAVALFGLALGRDRDDQPWAWHANIEGIGRSDPRNACHHTRSRYDSDGGFSDCFSMIIAVDVGSRAILSSK
jgi:hypothetical protein